MNFEISFLSVDYLKNINTKTSDFEKISKFKPVITGTIPFNIDHNFSDVDISAIFSNIENFSKTLRNLFSNFLEFKLE
ncbi:DUF4269 domain-containing protein [Leptospira noguchii]